MIAEIVRYVTWPQVFVGGVWFSLMVMFWLVVFDLAKMAWRRWRRRP